MISDLLAKEVDFFSIGTNDLTQYTLAIDRQNAKLDNIYDAHHEAVLRMIRMVVENAHKEGIWAGICGELGADILFWMTPRNRATRSYRTTIKFRFSPLAMFCWGFSLPCWSISGGLFCCWWC